MPSSLTENFSSGLGALTVVSGTWDASQGYARATVIPAEPEAIGVFNPGNSNYRYNEATYDPPLGSYAYFTVAAQAGLVAGTGFWLLCGGEDMTIPAICVTGRPVGVRTRYWDGSAMQGFTSDPQWAGTVSVGDVLRVEIIDDECRVGLNGSLRISFTNPLLARAGYHGVRIPHDSADSGVDDWGMDPLQSFTL